MAATSAQIAKLRRYIAEPGSAHGYSDGVLRSYIEERPLPDAERLESSDLGWVPTYDLHGAAAEIWTEKAGSNADDFDFTADGASYHLDQVSTHCMAQAKYHNSLSAADSVFVRRPISTTISSLYIGNLPEENI